MIPKVLLHVSTGMDWNQHTAGTELQCSNITGAILFEFGTVCIIEPFYVSGGGEWDLYY